MRLVLILLMLSAPLPAPAGEFVSDAFGLVPADAPADARRSRWSGWVGDGPTGIARSAETTDQVLLILGPKSLVAGKDRGHAVAILVDGEGNLVEDGTPVTLTIDGEPVLAATRSGIADHLFLPEPRAREILAGATSGRRQSARAMIRVVSDIGSIVPSLETVPGSVTAEAFFEIATGPMTDRFGNPAEDGVALAVLIEQGELGHSLSTGTVLGGRAGSRFLSRDIGGEARVAGWVGANGSPPVSLGIERPQPLSLPDLVAEDLPGIGSVRLTVGPFLTAYGYALTDGAIVTLRARTRSGVSHQAEGWVRDGYFDAVLPIAGVEDIGPVEVVTALGRMELGRARTSLSRLEAME